VQILVHLDISTKQQIESLAREPDGSLDASFIFDGQLARISLAGQVSILATLPKPASGPSLAAGIARDHDGNLYVLYSAGSTALNGVWRLSPDGTLGRIVAMPADAELNGMTLDEQTHNMYFVDSLKGAVYQAPIGGGIARVWAQTPELARLTFLGANGVHVRERAIWVSNTDQGTVVRFPIKGDGTAGSPTIVDNGLVGIDDFAFLSDGEIVAAMNAPNKVVLIGRHGSIMTLIRQTAPRIPPLFSSGGATSTSPTALITPASIRISCSSDSTRATAEDETIGPSPAPQPATGRNHGSRRSSTAFARARATRGVK
jgi:sugar lactone lactonase YvrE